MRLTCTACVPAAAGALVLATAGSAAGATPEVTAKVADDHLSYGEHLVVRGATQPGAAVVLQYRAVDAGIWTPVATAKAADTGRYRLKVALSRSGAVRVATAVPTATAGATAFTAVAPQNTTSARGVRVAAHLRATSTRLNVAAGRKARVSGSLRRVRAGRTVALQARIGRRWRTLDRDRTDARGRYRLSAMARRSADLRVRFGGDALNSGTRLKVGRMRAFRRSFASWYGPGFYGNRTACGQTFHAGIMGVAHKTLPCGTRLTFRRGTNLVHARVVDRGPFHAGREFDLSPAVKQALGFGSTGPVWVAI